jgi:hypothetical protein
MLFKVTATPYCDNHTKHTDTLYGQNAEFWFVKEGGTYSNHWAWLHVHYTVENI